MTELPRGTVTLLFTDIEGSTRLLQELGRDAYVRALEDHRRLLREVFAAHGGVEVEMQGDSFHFAFEDARGAVLAAAEAQRALTEHVIRVRIGIHTGEPLVTGDLYAGLDVHRAARVMGAAHGRQVLLSEATAALLAPHLPVRDLGEHRLKDLPDGERLYQLLGDGLASEFPPPRALHAPSLPVPPTPFLGRERELGELEALVTEADARLVTLTGPGGTGKTRLALALAERVATRFDGVRFVALAPVADPRLVLPTVAAAFDVPEAGEGLARALAAALEGRRLLLVLDNLEQVLPAAPELAELLAASPNLHMVATSRAALRLAAEREYHVPPLADDDAVELLLGRARAARPDLTLDAAATEAARGVAERLDRLPLALELAAARVRVLSLPSLLERLDAALPLLTGGPRDAPARQRTLRGAIDWSYGLLSDAERALLARLSVFAGGFALDAAQEVCDAELDNLEALVDHSLLRLVEADGDPRFSTLAVIREYAVERLEERGEAEDLRGRHAYFYLSLAADAEAHMVGTEATAQIRRVERDHDNMRAALAWATDRDPATALALGSHLQRFFYLGGYSAEGLRALEGALGRPGDVDPLVRGKALRAAGTLAEGTGDFARARSYLDEALVVLRPLGHQREIAVALNNVGAVASRQGDAAGAVRYFEESLELKRATGDRRGVAITLSNLGMLEARSGDYVAARAHQEQALAFLRELDETVGVANALAALGEVAVLEGDPAGARLPLEESLALYEDIGDDAATVEALALLARVSLAEGDGESARELAGRAAALMRTLDDAYGSITSLEVTADVVVTRGEPLRAVWLRAAASRLRSEAGAPEWQSERRWKEDTLGRARAALGPAEFERAWAEGASAGIDAALEWASEAREEPAAAASP